MEITPDQIRKFETFLLTNNEWMYTIDEIVAATKIPHNVIVQAMDFYVMETTENDTGVYYSLSYSMPSDVIKVFTTCPVCENPTVVTGVTMFERPILYGRTGGRGLGALYCNHCKLYLSVAKRYAIKRKCYCQIVWGKPKKQLWLWIRNHRWQCSNCGAVEVWRTENRPEVDHIGLYVIGTGNNDHEVQITDTKILERWEKWKEMERTGVLYEKWR